MKVEYTKKMRLVRYKFTAADLSHERQPIINGTISVLIKPDELADSLEAKTVAQNGLLQFDLKAPLYMIRPETVIDYELNPEQIIRDAEFAGNFVP